MLAKQNNEEALIERLRGLKKSPDAWVLMQLNTASLNAQQKKELREPAAQKLFVEMLYNDEIISYFSSDGAVFFSLRVHLSIAVTCCAKW